MQPRLCMCWQSFSSACKTLTAVSPQVCSFRPLNMLSLLSAHGLHGLDGGMS